MRKFVVLMIEAVIIFGAAALIHNLIYRMWGVEEPFLLLIAVFVAPILFAVGLLGLSVTAIRRILKLN